VAALHWPAKSNICKQISTATNSASNYSFKLKHHPEVTAKRASNNYQSTLETTAASIKINFKKIQPN
jgi:hypothetical protein